MLARRFSRHCIGPRSSQNSVGKRLARQDSISLHYLRSERRKFVSGMAEFLRTLVPESTAESEVQGGCD